MAYSLIEQQTRDIDWYIGNLRIGNILHFASGGGRLPQIIEDNDNLNESINHTILSATAEFKYQVNPNLSQILGIEGMDLENYLVDFIFRAQRGLHTFDKTNLNDFNDMTYHIVAWPIYTQKTQLMNFHSWFFEQNKQLILDVSNIPFYEQAEKNQPFKLRLE